MSLGGVLLFTPANGIDAFAGNCTAQGEHESEEDHDFVRLSE